MMKRCMIAGLAALTLMGTAQALPGKDGMNSPLWPSTWARYDTNSNGKLEDGEWKIDLNKDGQVDDKEIADARIDYERWAKKSQAAYDANDDGKLDDHELIEWRKSCPQ